MNGDSSLVVQAPSLFPAHPIASAAVQPVDSVRGDDNDHDQQTSSPFDGSPQINSNSSNSQLLTSSDASTVSSQVADDTNNKLRQMSSGDEQQQQHQQRQQRELEMAKVDGGALLEHVNGQIELVEHTPDAATSTLDDSREWAPDNDYELKRVKVYELIGSRWVDQGTAFCFGQFQEDTREALLIARAERNYNDIILSTIIRGNDVYQRQQDTLIVWTEPDGVDYALSFQDPDGCLEVWNFIIEVQRHMNSTDDTVLISSPVLGPENPPPNGLVMGFISMNHLPPPALGNINDVERAIKHLARNQASKDRVCEFIVQEEYFRQLLEVMQHAEDLESLETLHALCNLTQTILMLNDHSVYEHILELDLFIGVVGMLEYDPEFPEFKANYRDFLQQTTKFHQPIPIRDATIQRKIHYTYRLQFLKDVVLARILDDSTFNVLNSCILFNQIDIIQHIQQEHSFLWDVVRLFVDEDMLNAPSVKRQAAPPQHMIISLGGEFNPADDSAMDVDPPIGPPSPKNNGVSPAALHTPLLISMASRKRSESYAFAPPEDMTPEDVNLRRQVILLLQQLCVMGKNVQLPARLALFRSLVDRGVLFAVQWAMGLPEVTEGDSPSINKPTISAGGEILSALLDHDLNGVRGHVLKQILAIEKEREMNKQGADKAETILEMVCKIMASSGDLAVQCQVGDALKVWLDIPPPEPSNPGGGEMGNVVVARLANGPRKEDPGTERFMEYFYKQCVHILLKPLVDLPEWRLATDPIFPLTREQTNRFLYLCDLLFSFIQQHSFRGCYYILSSGVLTRVATLLKARDKHLRHASFRIFRLLLKQNNPSIHNLIIKNDILKPILDLTLSESRRDNLLSCSCQEYFELMRKESMKEMIKFCMTQHEAEIRKLAETPLGGQRFELLIRRYEMYNEPLPEESKPDSSLRGKRLWPKQERAMDEEEENYFNGDDDEDDDTNIPSISRAWSNAARRKHPHQLARRGGKPGAALGALMDYEDDDEEYNSSSSSKSGSTKGPPSSLAPSPTLTQPKISSIYKNTSSPSSSSSLSPIEPPSMFNIADEDEDEEDAFGSMLKSKRRAPVPAPALSTPSKSNTASTSSNGASSSPSSASGSPASSPVNPLSRPTTPGPGIMVSPTSLRGSEKRRRSEYEDEDDDDEFLGRLVKVKKPDPHAQGSPGADVFDSGSRNTSPTRPSSSSSTGDDKDKKKIQVRLGISNNLFGGPIKSQNPSATATSLSAGATASTTTATLTTISPPSLLPSPILLRSASSASTPVSTSNSSSNSSSESSGAAQPKVVTKAISIDVPATMDTDDSIGSPGPSPMSTSAPTPTSETGTKDGDTG